MSDPAAAAPRHPGALATAAVRGLTPYQPGKPISELERELGLKDIVKLASNENPWGASTRVLEAIAGSLGELWLYPDGNQHELKHALAATLRVDPSMLTLGNGSNELLLLLAETFLSEAHNAVVSQYAFAIYPLVVRATGAELRTAPAFSAEAAMPLGHDVDAMAAAIDAHTRLVFIANPNNPTGTWVEPAKLLRFIDAAPAQTIVVLDEAYLEYGRARGCQDGLAWVHTRPNLVLLRTFSKAHGLAGLRVGYAVSHPEVAEMLNRIRPAFNVNALAQIAATVALSERAHVESIVARTLLGLEQLEAGLRALKLRWIPSAANFLLVHVGPRAGAVCTALEQAGIIVRPVGGYGLPEYLRISVGTTSDNARVLAALGRLC